MAVPFAVIKIIVEANHRLWWKRQCFVIADLQATITNRFIS